MKPQDLRIGNIIQRNNRWGRVYNLTSLNGRNQIWASGPFMENYDGPLEEIEPVYINDFVQMKYPGLSSFEVVTQHRVFRIIKYPLINNYTWQIWDKDYVATVYPFLHNIQNLVFALTGEEWIIDLDCIENSKRLN